MNHVNAQSSGVTYLQLTAVRRPPECCFRGQVEVLFTRWSIPAAMELLPVSDLPEIQAGDDIGALISDRTTLRPTDIVLVASTIVSKAEDRGADLTDFEPTDRAREIAERIGEIVGGEKDPRYAQAVLEESAEILMDAPFLLTVTHFGHIGVNAGIDRSNTGGADLLLLPERPSESADRIRSGLPGQNPVIVTDTCGRPFRHGQVGVAIGWAGMPASRDWRGLTDRDGRELHVTVESVVDELAGAANLVGGEGDDGIPVVIARGVEIDAYDGSQALFRDEDTDFVRAALASWNYDRQPVQIRRRECPDRHHFCTLRG